MECDVLGAHSAFIVTAPRLKTPPAPHRHAAAAAAAAPAALGARVQDDFAELAGEVPHMTCHTWRTT